MANTYDKQVTLDGYRNASVKISGVLDSGNLVLVPAVQFSDFLTNEQNVRLFGFRVDCVTYSISNPMVVSLEWNGATPQLIFALSGRGKLKGRSSGGTLPDTSRSGYDGTINLRTAGYPSGTTASFTIALDLVKMYR